MFKFKKKESDLKKDGGDIKKGKNAKEGEADSVKGEAKEKKFDPFMKIRSRFIILVLFSLAALCIIFIILLVRHSAGSSGAKACGDGSFYDTCAVNKPYFCSNGTLIEDSGVCGCASNLTRSGDSCVSKYQTGEIKTLNFSYVLEGREGAVQYALYGGMASYLSTLPGSITYLDGEQPKRSDFALKRIDETNQEVLLEGLVKKIENLAPDSKLDQARIAVSLVQNIPWGSSGQTVNFGGIEVNVSRYPYNVLYDDQGLCGEKSELLAFILRDLGYGVALFYYPVENHEVVGIKCPPANSFENTGYCFVETSGAAIISDSHLVYANGATLASSPQVSLISEGISLPEGIPEYGDARKLESLKNRWWLDPFSSAILKNLENKYGLGEVYNIN